MFWILGPISNSDILNYLSCQDLIEMTSINAKHKHYHPASFGLSEQMGLKSLDSLFNFQALPLLWQNIWTQLQLNPKKPEFGFTDCIVLFFLLAQGFNHLPFSQNWFKKICVTNSHRWIICSNPWQFWILSGIHEKDECLWHESHGCEPCLYSTWKKKKKRILISGFLS